MEQLQDAAEVKGLNYTPTTPDKGDSCHASSKVFKAYFATEVLLTIDR